MVPFWAKVRPQRPAIIAGDMIITYQAFAEGLDKVASRIATYEFNRQKPVAVAIENPSILMLVCLALVRSGLSAAPTNRGMLPYLRSAGISDLIYASEGQVLSGGRNIRYSDTWLQEGGKIASPPVGAAERYGHMVYFTSGTTGIPKQFVQTPESMIERLNASLLARDVSYSRVLIVPGLSSSFGFNRACEALHEGKTACFARNAEEILWAVESFGVDLIIASTQQALDLARAAEKNGGHPLASLKAIKVGGALPSKDLIRRVQTSICRNVIIVYSSTEAGAAATAPYELIAGIPGAVGYLTPWAELQIVDEAGAPLPANSEGIVRYRTPFFLRSGDAADESRDAERWFYPGDRGFVTEDGVLCLAGRGDDVINRGGVKISAVELEEIVASCPGVEDAGVCSVKNASGIDQVWVAVVPGPAFDLVEFQHRLKQNRDFARKFKDAIDEIHAVDQIPRGQLGKVQRHELREKLLSRPQDPRE
jgi:acyl-coenzyme A synthetase/AMP-(fatty) acid ligase